MDTITHTLIGMTTYGAINKKKMTPEAKRVLFAAALVGSQIPDSDIVLQLTEKGRIMYQMWHRGLSHSIIMAPIWALLIYVLCYLIWRRKDRLIFYIGLLNVFIHIGSDALNTWGTGLFEPFSSRRITLGVVSIVDFTVWGIMLLGYLFIKLRKSTDRHRVWRTVWIVILIHVSLQSLQGYIIHREAEQNYKQSAISAGFIPWYFSVIGKNGNVVEIYSKNLWSDKKMIATLDSRENTNLSPLFEGNPRAEVLMQWSPFVVVVDDGKVLGIYDPRFYRNGESFLYEYIKEK